MRIVNDQLFNSINTTNSDNLPLIILPGANVKPIGCLAYNLTNNQIYYSNGLEWVPVGGSTTLPSLTITGTTQSTSCQTGALIVDGGVGIEKDLWSCGSGHFGYTGNVNPLAPFLMLQSGGSNSTSTTLLGSQTVDRILTLPDITDTLVSRNSIDTLTNKTLTSPIINTPTINGTGGLLTLPSGPDTLVGRNTIDTLTNKTLTSPVINTPTINGTGGLLTLPSGPDTLVGRNTIDTLTNKSITDSTDNVTASSLFSANRTNTISVFAATNPSSGQVLTATSSTTATWQSPASLGYGSAFGVSGTGGSPDYTATVAVNAPIPIPQDNVYAGSVSRNNSSSFTLSSIGFYSVIFQASITEAAQIAIWLDPNTGTFAAIQNSRVGRAGTTAQLVINTIVHVTVANSKIAIYNDSSPAAITITPIAGGTGNVTTSITIQRLS